MFALKDNEALLALKQQLQAKKIRLEGSVKTTSRGFGFLETNCGQSAFIPKGLMYGLLPESVIVVDAEDTEKGLAVTEIKKIVEKGQTQFFCEVDVFFIEDREYANAFPLRPDVEFKMQLGQRGKTGVAKGDIVLVDVVSTPQKGKGKYRGEILHILGNKNDPATMWTLVKEEFSLNDNLEEISVNEMPDFGNKDYWVGKRGYKDLTHIPLCTIDSYSSRDLDDALFVKEFENDWELTVAIADPTSIVEDNVPLKELLVERGVTHYLATEIIHLMAKFFSEDNFSLLENEFRPSLVSTISVSKSTGDVVLKTIELGVIKSRAKLSYDQVSEHIKQRAVGVIDDDLEISESLNQLYEMSQVRLRHREENNLVGLDDKEFYFIIEDGVPVGVRESIKTLAHSMVEEAAIAGNVAFTQWAQQNNLPIVYVTHEGFKQDSHANVVEYLLTRGVEVTGNESISTLFDVAHSHFFQQVKLAESSEDAYEIALARKNLTELRGFYQKGELSLDASPHKPMGMPAYGTWTSPIRKSVDMLNHLVAKAAIRGEDVNVVKQGDLDKIQGKIRSSKQAERKLWKMLGLSYLSHNKSEPLPATLTQVLKRAARFEVEGTGISITMGFKELAFDGFVKLDSVEQKIIVDDETALRLSDSILVNVASVNVYGGSILAKRFVA